MSDMAAVLCVDDEPNILSALRRLLRAHGCRVLTAGGGPEALGLLRNERIDIVISDMRMPEMDGTQLLEQVSQGWPDVFRILLTGHADIQSTIAAINRGGLDRYLTKPWNEAELVAAVRQGLDLIRLRQEKERLEALTQQQNEQLRLANAGLEERVAQRTADLLEANGKLGRSFMTSIKVFSNLIELRGGQMIGHGRRVAALAQKVARATGLDGHEVQNVFVAGLLHDIGLIGLPDSMLDQPVGRMSAATLAEFSRHPALGEQALMPLDDLQGAAPLIRSHHERFDGRGFPDQLRGAEIPVGARILAIVESFDDLQHARIATSPVTPEQARTLMRQGRGSQFDPEMLDVFLHLTEPERAVATTALSLETHSLEPGMVLAADLVSKQGSLLLASGQPLTQALILQIRKWESRCSERLVLAIRPAPSGSKVVAPYIS